MRSSLVLISLPCVLRHSDNPWVCDDRLQWLRQWLRDNPDIMIDKGPGCLAECTAPANLLNVRLRDPDPITFPPIDDAPLPAARRAAMPTLGWIILGKWTVLY